MVVDNLNPEQFLKLSQIFMSLIGASRERKKDVAHQFAQTYVLTVGATNHIEALQGLAVIVPALVHLSQDVSRDEALPLSARKDISQAIISNLAMAIMGISEGQFPSENIPPFVNQDTAQA